MKNILNICKVVIVASILFGACSPNVHRSAMTKDERTDAEKRFDPVGFPGDEAIITGHKQAAPKTQVVEAEGVLPDRNEKPAFRSDTLNRGEQIAQQVIFRVQIYASKSFDDAQQFAANIKPLFEQGVYVEYQMPYYKVRVGEFHNPEEGEAFLDQVKLAGFKNAWLVRVIR